MQEDIVVTGPRIRRKDLTGPAPVVVYTREQMQASGRVNVGEFLQTIPEQSNAIGRGTNNGGAGAIRVNLRGIGPQSTLVLLNGRRLAPGGTGADDSVNLSAIPTNVIERIEILKDGASAIYGSDATGGVINIITRKRLDGGDISVLGSTSSRGDGRTVDVSGMLGATSDKGSFPVSMGYYRAAPVYSGDRAFSRDQRVFDSTTGQVTALGSGTIPNGRIVLPPGQAGMANGDAAWNDLVRANPMATSFTRDADGTWRPFRGANLDQDGYNFQPANYLVTPQSRFNVFVTGEYRLGRFARAYVDSFYTKRSSDQVLASEPLILDQEGVVVSANNIYNPFGRDFDAVRRRLVELGGRASEQDIHNFHVVTGIDGTTPDSVFTAGVVIEPRGVKGLYFTGDYYNTWITNSIKPPGGNVILQSCYPDAAGAVPEYCGFIHRNPNTQRIEYIDNLDAGAAGAYPHLRFNAIANKAGQAGGVAGGVVGGTVGGVIGEFDSRMTPPRLISGPTIEYIDKALENDVEGLMIVRCVLTTAGEVRGCEVRQSVRFMDSAVVQTLQKRRYTPVTLTGRPIEVYYTFRIRLTLPR